MAGTSPAKKQARARAAATEKAQKEQPSASLSPTAEALEALKNLASPLGTTSTIRQASNQNNITSNNANPETKNAAAVGGLRIQAPAVQSSSGRSSGADLSGPTAESPAASGLSSPADDGLDTPDAGGPSKRPRHLDPIPPSTTPRTPNATPTPTPTPPLFLEKTFEMLDKCSPQVACWSVGGDSFIVKNPVAFAEHVIPIYFKHKNFSSFVRQLNFYGFRKVRVVDPDVTGGVDPKDWWEFRHDKFQRGHKELLKDIKRRSLPTSTTSNATSSSGGSSSTTDAGAVATVDRGEIDELRTEVATLREQIQTLNKHVFSVMQIMMTRNASTPTAAAVTAPSVGFAVHTPHHPHHHHHAHHAHAFAAQSPHHPQAAPSPHMMSAYSFMGGLPPPHVVASDGKPRGAAATPSASPGGAMQYALRPLQAASSSSYMGAMGVAPPPPGYPYAVTPSGDPSIDWDLYSRHAFQAAHAAHAAQAQAAAQTQAAAQAQTQAAAAASTPASSTSSTSTAASTMTTTTATSVPAVAGLKRTRSQQHKQPSSAAAVAPSTPSTASASTPLNPVENPEAAVRQLSMQVTQIRSDLLRSILSRTLAFIRSQPPATTATTPSTPTPLAQHPEIDAIASAITDDIQQRMGQIDDAEAATHGRPRGSSSATSQTSHMYRVEMLKFVSKELPRAMSDAVEKQLPAPTKKTLNRSLLALMVQKAQAALETQMRTETATTSPSNSTSTTSTRTPRN